MGSRNGWAEGLAKRCSDVGWEVTFASGGHRRIKTHEGKVFSLASSTSDVHGQKNAERVCIRHGLERLELQMALRSEKERLRRLEEDRKNGVDWDAEEEMRQKEMQKIKAETEGSLGYVNGIAVAERVPAVAGHPRSPNMKVPIKHGQELLLVDETVIYQCTHEITRNDIKQDCGRFFETSGSLRSHIAWHARKGKPEVEKTDFFDDPRADEDEKTIVVENEVPEVIEKQPGIIARMVNLADEFDELVDDIAEFAENVRVKRNELRRLVAELPQHVADGETREKARKYDEMRKLLD